MVALSLPVGKGSGNGKRRMGKLFSTKTNDVRSNKVSKSWFECSNAFSDYAVNLQS